MTTTTLVIGWLLMPAIAAFLAALFPKLGSGLLIGVPVVSLGLGATLIGPGASLLPLSISASPAVTLNLSVDQLPFVLLNASVLIAVALQRSKQSAGHLQNVLLLVLHGALNSIYVAADLVCVYVAIELISIVSFLLMVDLKKRASLWVAFRYLMIGDLAMLLFLLGVLITYSGSGSFALDAAAEAPVIAIILLITGLLIKSEAFLPGFWLPKTHAAISPEVSALLSGSVVSAGIAPLARIGQVNAVASQQLLVLGVLSVLIGAAAAMVQKDIKRLLAWSTVSQMGFTLIVPAAAGFYALAHGLGKAALFLTAGRLPTRSLALLQQQAADRSLTLPMLVASLSLIGIPLSSGYAAKDAVVAALPRPLDGIVSWLGLATALVLARLLPDQWPAPASDSALGQAQSKSRGPMLGVWLLCLALFVLPLVLHLPLGVKWASFLKAASVLGLAVLGERLLRQPLKRWTPPDFETFSSLVVACGLTMLIGNVIGRFTPLSAALP